LVCLQRTTPRVQNPDKALIVETEAVKGGFNGLPVGDLQFIANNPLSGAELRDTALKKFHTAGIQRVLTARTERFSVLVAMTTRNGSSKEAFYFEQLAIKHKGHLDEPPPSALVPEEEKQSKITYNIRKWN
jgi:hypothetical protein